MRKSKIEKREYVDLDKLLPKDRPGPFLSGVDYERFRVPTFTGKPGKPEKMRVHLENLEKSWNFAKNNKNHGKITWNLEKYLGRL